MHSGKKWRSALWLNAMHSGRTVMNSRIHTPFSIFFLNPDYVAARSLLRSNNSSLFQALGSWERAKNNNKGPNKGGLRRLAVPRGP